MHDQPLLSLPDAAAAAGIGLATAYRLAAAGRVPVTTEVHRGRSRQRVRLADVHLALAPPPPEPPRPLPPVPAPFPICGGKRRVAGLVWSRLGDVQHYLEPFAGSAAVLLGRPTPPRVETLNDADCHIANFWRAIRADAGAVAEWADWPVNAADLGARHAWLTSGPDATEFRRRVRSDLEFYNAKFAGYWVWGMGCWLGSGWCKGEESGPATKRPDLTGDCRSCGAGVHGCTTGRPNRGNDTSATPAARRAWLVEWFNRLAARLRNVRVCCGDWSKLLTPACLSPRYGSVGILLDPPYGAGADRYPAIYSVDDMTVAGDVVAWCLEHGADRRLRIALAGMAGEHEQLEAAGWSVVAWKSQGGYGRNDSKGRANAHRERLWFSPACLSS